MIFVDSNVPMYLVGSPHPLRELLTSYLRQHIDESYVTSVEVYQELIHRYVAIDRREAIADGFQVLDSLVEAVYSIERADVDRAHQIALQQARLSGRDCLHLSVMEHHRVDRILTFDRQFELWPSIVRLP